MVRVPAKTCPNLSRLFDRGEPELVTGFLNSKAFQREKWLEEYKNQPVTRAAEMLGKERKDRLGPLETEAARIFSVASARGHYALEGIAELKLESERFRLMIGQKDELARSLWAYVNERMLFEGAENTLHMSLYRRYDKHYQTFLAEPSDGVDEAASGQAIDTFVRAVGTALNRGEGYRCERFDVPGEDGMSGSELYMLFHPKAPTSMREISEEGELTTVYLRAPGEATVIYFPATGYVHVRAATRALRHLIAEQFIARILDQPVSSRPVDFQAYDIRQFRNFYELSRPVYEDVLIEVAKVIKLEVSIGDLRNRLAISTTVDGNLGALAAQCDGLVPAFQGAIATRFVEFAVKYRKKFHDTTRTLNFSVTDRNTCSLLSVEDPFEAILGHRLMQDWGVATQGRAPTFADTTRAMPGLLELWEGRFDKVLGSWLVERHIDPGLLVELGFLVPAGSGDEENFDVIDDEDIVGQVAAEVISQPDGPVLRATSGLEAPSGYSETYRVYRIRTKWVTEHLVGQLASSIGNIKPEPLGDDLHRLGDIDVDGARVPLYLARGLKRDVGREAVDALLWSRRGSGIGLVLQAGSVPGTFISTNVLARAASHISGEPPNVILDLNSLRAVYRQSLGLASGGENVTFEPADDTSRTLSVPGKGSVFICGPHRVAVIRKLVEAHHRDRRPVLSADLRKDINDQSMSNIFGRDLWKRLKDGFVRQPKPKYWEIDFSGPNSVPTPPA